MGVIQTLPLCSRGNKEENPTPNAIAGDENNNQPMPSLQATTSANVVSVQPLSASHLQQNQPTSLTNPHADLDTPPEATSTPKNRRYSSSIESEHGVDGVVDEELGGQSSGTSDSGLEQSSSDELELGKAALGAKKSVLIREDIERPFSAADNNVEMQNIPLDQDEGINETLEEGTISLENHQTSESDDAEDDDEVEEPLERPPEPTVPDERVDSYSSSSGSNRTSPARPLEGFVPHRKPGDATTDAISNLLSEIVGTDKPYGEVPDGSSGFVTSVVRDSAQGR